MRKYHMKKAAVFAIKEDVNDEILGMRMQKEHGSKSCMRLGLILYLWTVCH